MEKVYRIGNLHTLRLECYDPKACHPLQEIDATTENLYRAIAEQCIAKFQASCGLSFYLEIRDFKQKAAKENLIAIIATVDGAGNDAVDYNKGGELAILATRQNYSANRVAPKQTREGRVEVDVYMFARKEGDVIIAPSKAKLLTDQLWESIHTTTTEVLLEWQVEFLDEPEEFQPLDEE